MSRLVQAQLNRVAATTPGWLVFSSGHFHAVLERQRQTIICSVSVYETELQGHCSRLHSLRLDYADPDCLSGLEHWLDRVITSEVST